MLKCNRLKFILVMSVLLVSACTNELAEIKDSELRSRAYRCVVEADQSTAEIQVCKNLERECERRREEGNFVC